MGYIRLCIEVIRLDQSHLELLLLYVYFFQLLELLLNFLSLPLRYGPLSIHQEF
jgi:hypothetical protein